MNQYKPSIPINQASTRNTKNIKANKKKKRQNKIEKERNRKTNLMRKRSKNA
jgi:hypothetical protein